MEYRLTEGRWMALDVYLTVQVQEHLSLQVGAFISCGKSVPIRAGGTRRRTSARSIAEVEVCGVLVSLAGVSEAPHTDAGREPRRVGPFSVGGGRVARGLRHVTAPRGRSLTKRLLVRRIVVELPRERTLSAEAALSWQLSCARLAQLRHLGNFAFSLPNRLLARYIHI